MNSQDNKQAGTDFQRVAATLNRLDMYEARFEAAAPIIMTAIRERLPGLEVEQNHIYAGGLLSSIQAKEDITATLSGIEHIDPAKREHPTNFDTPRSFAIFTMRCAPTALNENDEFHSYHRLFEALGFQKFCNHASFGTIPQNVGENWCAHFSRGYKDESSRQAEDGYFEIMVPLESLLKNLGLDPDAFYQDIHNQIAPIARERGLSMDDFTPA